MLILLSCSNVGENAMKARVLLLSLGLSLVTLFTAEAYGQQPMSTSETEVSRLEHLERTAKELDRKLDDARKESKKADEVAKNANKAEKAALAAAKQAKKAYITEKKARNARIKADKAAGNK